nr:FtsX-like permease family protein [Nonomuraea sp. ATCC 55076]
MSWAYPVRAIFAILNLHGRKLATTVIGTEPGGQGGPWRMAAGRVPWSTDELVVDRVLADQHNLRIGDEVEALGRRLTIVGLSADTTGFMVGFVFTTHATTDALLSAPDTTTFILVGTEHPEVAAAALRAKGLSVTGRDELAESNLMLATRVYGQPLRLMVAVAFAAGVLVIALTTYGAVAEQRRLLGLLAALGATRWRLYRFAIAYVAAIAVAGMILSSVLFVLGRTLIGWWRPQFPVAPTTRDILTAVAATLVMAALASVLPARRISRTDPADTFRSTT